MVMMSLGWGRYSLVILGIVTLVVQLRTDTGLSLVVPRCIQEQGLFLQQRMKKTAVVWTTKGITTECEAARVRHLVETAGSMMDVWVLHSHHYLEMERHYDAVEQSRKHIASIPGLRQWPQSLAIFDKFDGASGSAKGSFLRFMVDHPEYEFGWHIENDMFFTGPWEDVFQKDMLQDTETDFLATHVQRKERNQDWHHHKRCTIFRKMCTSIQRTQVNWMIARVSARLAKSLVQDLFKKQVVGHHEAVIGPYCRMKKYKLREINRNMVGTVISGHTGSLKMDAELAKKVTVASFNPQKGKLLHPLKCDAYDDGEGDTTTMQSDIDKYTTGRAWHSWSSFSGKQNPNAIIFLETILKNETLANPKAKIQGKKEVSLPNETVRKQRLKRASRNFIKPQQQKPINKALEKIESYKPTVKINTAQSNNNNNNNQLFSLPPTSSSSKASNGGGQQQEIPTPVAKGEGTAPPPKLSSAAALKSDKPSLLLQVNNEQETVSPQNNNGKTSTGSKANNTTTPNTVNTTSAKTIGGGTNKKESLSPADDSTSIAETTSTTLTPDVVTLPEEKSQDESYPQNVIKES